MSHKYSRLLKKSLNNGGNVFSWFKNHLKMILSVIFTAFIVFTLSFGIYKLQKTKDIKYLDNVYIFTEKYNDEEYLSNIESLKEKYKDDVSNIYVYQNAVSHLTLQFRITKSTYEKPGLVSECVVIEKPFGEHYIRGYSTDVLSVDNVLGEYYERV